MKTPFFIPRDFISIIAFLAALKFACSTNLIRKKTTMWVLHFVVKNRFASTKNSRMSAAINITPAVASAHMTEPLRKKKFVRPYQNVVCYLFEKFANDQDIAEKDYAILLYVLPANMTPVQYADDLYSKFCKVADVYGESTLNDIFIKELNLSICHSLGKH